ncbi:MAG TPA: hypothetical protein VII97_14675, partial [Anaerolineales bacterium]
STHNDDIVLLQVVMVEVGHLVSILCDKGAEGKRSCVGIPLFLLWRGIALGRKTISIWLKLLTV